MKDNRFPPGWDEKRVQRLLEHYDSRIVQGKFLKRDAFEKLVASVREAGRIHARRDQMTQAKTGSGSPKATGRGRAQAPPKMDEGAISASRLFDQRIRDLSGWRGETLGRMRALILEAVPEMTEEWKWVKPTSPGTPVWSHHGIVCTGEAYTKVVKLTFARGATVPDPARLFNSSLEGNTRRAIDIHEGETVDARAFKALVKAAVARNDQPAKAPKKAAPKKASPARRPSSRGKG